MSWPLPAQYALSIGVVLAALGVRWLIDPYAGDRLQLLLVAVVLLPLLVIVRAGPFLAAATVGWSLSRYFFFPPRASLAIAGPIEALTLGLYGAALLAAGLTAWFAGRLHDVSAQAEHARARLAAIVEASDDAIISKSLDGTIRSWNAGAERLFGYSQKEAVGQPISIIVPPELLAEQRQILQRIRGGERVDHFETVRMSKDCRRLVVSISISPVRDERGRLVGASKIARNITESKLADERIAALRDDLRSHAEERDALLSVLPVGVFVARDAECSQITMNAAGAEMLWIEPGMNASKSSDDGALLPFRVFREGVEVSAEELPMQRAARTAQPVWGETFELRHNDGRKRWLYEYAVPLFGEEGRVRGCVGAFVDITGRKEAEQLIEKRAAEQGALFRLTDRLHRAGSLEEVYDAALDSITSALGCDRASILLFDEHEVMRFVAWRRLSDNYRAAAAGHSPWKADEKHPEPITMPDLAASEIGEPLRSVIEQEGIRALGFIPLVTEGRLIGKFMLYYDAPHDFSAGEIELALIIARQLAFGVERKRADAQRRRTQEALRQSEARHRKLAARLTLLLQTTSHLIKSLDVDELLASVLGLSRELVAADAFAVWRQDAAGVWSAVSSEGLSEEFISSSIQAAQDASVPVEAIVVQPEDLADRSTPLLHARWKHYEREGIGSLMILPLYIHGQVTGTLVFYCRTPHHFGSTEVESARALANIAAAAITTAELYDAQSQLLRRAEDAAVRESFLAAAGAILAESLDYEQTLANVARAAVPEFADWCGVDLSDDQGQLRRLAVAHIDPAKVSLAHELTERYPTPPDAPSGPQHVLRTGEPELVSEIGEDLLRMRARDEHHRRLLEQADIRSYICVPIRGRAGIPGTMTFVAGTGKRRFDERDLSVAIEIARRAGQAIDNAMLYRDRQRSEEALRDADRRKDEFLATLAHELRNPLAPIRSALEIMKRTDGSQMTPVEARRAIERQVEQLVRLVDDLLDVSRITRDRLELRKAPAELAPIIRQAIETSCPLADAEEQTVEVSLPAGPVYLEADAVRLGQVFSNLLNNACKFTPRGGTIRIAARRQGGSVSISVKDEGIGIPAEKLGSIFEMFSQVDKSLEKAQGGLGIGLTLAKRLVELHDGSISVRSDGPGRGSEFIVRLPVASHLTESEIPAEPDQTNGELADFSGVAGRILVVDDNVDAARTLALLLRMAGSETEIAHDGVTALERAERFRPEAILLDIGMPGMSGHDVCRAIRRRKWGQDVVIIALTGWGQDEDRRRSHAAGFDGHLVKPVEPQTIRQTIGELLASREA